MKEKNGSNGENHSMAVFDPKIVKIKNASDGENLIEPPKDGRFDILPQHYHERSSVLIEPTQSINIGTTEKARILHLAASMTDTEKLDFIKFFEERCINFAWSYSDMPGLDIDLIMHHLSLPAGTKPIKQKLRKMHPHVTLLVKNDLKKLLDAGFIRSIDYAEWISNIVPVSKPDNTIRICTNFQDLIRHVQRMIFLCQT